MASEPASVPGPGTKVLGYFSWTLAGNVLYAGGQWGALMLLGHLGSAQLLGEFAFALAVTTPLIFLVNLGLRTIAATDIAGQYSLADYVHLRLWTNLAALVALAGLCAAVAGGSEQTLLVAIVGVGKLLDSTSDAFQGYLQARERMDVVAKSLALNGILSTALLPAGLLATDNVVGGAVGWALASAGSLAYLGFWMATQRGWAAIVEGRRGSIRRLARLGLPLSARLTLTAFAPVIPRYAIERDLGARDLGLFAGATYVLTIGSTLAVAIGQAATPRLVRMFDEQDFGSFYRLLVQLCLASAIASGVVIVGAIVAGKTAMLMMYGDEFADAHALLVWASVANAVGVLAAILTYGLSAARLFAIQAPIYLAVVIVTGVSSFALVPRYGVEGGTLALIAMYLTQVVLTAIAIRHATKPWAVTASTATESGESMWA